MGGGAMWRGVSRLVNSVSPAARAVPAASSNACSICKINASAPTPTTQSVHSSCACAPETVLRSESVADQGIRAMWEPHEWEFAEDEERIDRLVFGSLPSRTEIEEASSDLQNALRLCLAAPSIDPPEGSGDISPAMVGLSGKFEESISTVEKVFPAMASVSGASEEVAPTANNDDEVSKPLVLAQMAMDWMEPPPPRTGLGALQVGGRNNVVEAFRQFQQNPEVQDMVASLANDPAVWGAVMSNEKIQEFKRRLRGETGFFVNKDTIFADVNEEPRSPRHGPNIFTRCQMYWQSKISDLKDVLNNIINSLFKGSDTDKKGFTEDDADFVDWTIKSCAMVAIVVVCVVLFKRMP